MRDLPADCIRFRGHYPCKQERVFPLVEWKENNFEFCACVLEERKQEETGGGGAEQQGEAPPDMWASNPGSQWSELLSLIMHNSPDDSGTTACWEMQFFWVFLRSGNTENDIKLQKMIFGCHRTFKVPYLEKSASKGSFLKAGKLKGLTKIYSIWRVLFESGGLQVKGAFIWRQGI